MLSCFDILPPSEGNLRRHLIPSSRADKFIVSLTLLMDGVMALSRVHPSVLC